VYAATLIGRVASLVRCSSLNPEMLMLSSSVKVVVVVAAVMDALTNVVGPRLTVTTTELG
jgi:hypothetical protein